MSVRPCESVTVPMKVVSAVIAGVVVEPPETGVAFPMPLLMLKLVPRVVVQVSTEVPPEVTWVGFAESVQDGPPPPPPPRVTATAHVAVWPLALVTVPVKVVFVVMFGVVVEPFPTGVTVPTPLSMTNVAPLVVVQESTEVPPEEPSEVGFAERSHVGAGGAVVTVTGAAQDTGMPVAPLTRAVKVVLAVIGGVVVEPLATGVTIPTPLSITIDVAFEVFHESIAVPPEATEEGVAVNELQTAGN